MIATFLLRNWQVVAIGLLSIALAGALKLWRSEVAAFDLYKAQVVAATEAFNKKQADDKIASDNLIAKKEKENAKAIETISIGFGTELDRLRHDNASRRNSAKPVRFSPLVCENSSGNDRLLIAVEKFEQSVDDRMAEYQEGVGKLLEQAQFCATTLTKVNEWIAGEQLINR